ncbi:MAG: TIGR00269 family protein [Candidatus Bathyarchaeota archaeon]|nr:TIGR00269 family protein [Candidatus Bathyarchaeota archaeon]
MLRFDDQIAIGLSGGKDSMALLNILYKLEDSFPKTTLIAVTVDEGIKQYRDEALRIAEKSCQKLGIEQVVVSFKELFGYNLDEIVEILRERKSEHSSTTPCAYCGVLRRRALNIAAQNCGATKLATAHNLDDENQTLLLNIMHGDLFRMGRAKKTSHSNTARFVKRIKPVCEILEKETTFYAFLNGIEFQNTPCPYSTAALRNDIRNMLNKMEEKHPGLKYTLYHSAEKLKTLIIDASKVDVLNACKICNEPSANEICQPCKILLELK